MDISVIIPAYEKLLKIPQALKNLKFHGDYEIIVAGDALNKKDEAFLKRKGVVTCLSKKRRGKAKAVNEAVKLAKGELLVFLDSDTRPEDEYFLEVMWSYFIEKQFDMATGKLMIEGNSFLEKLANIDYLFINSGFYLGSLTHKAIPVNGAFFVMKRESFNEVGGYDAEITEDVGIGFKARKEKMTFCYMKDVVALTASHTKLKKFMIQRKRWILGSAEIAKNKKRLIKNLPISTMMISSYFPLLGFTILSMLGFMFWNSPLLPSKILIWAVSLTGFFMMIMTRLLDWETSPKQYAGYLFVYGPVWTLLGLISGILFLIRKTPKKLTDWKV